MNYSVIFLSNRSSWYPVWQSDLLLSSYIVLVRDLLTSHLKDLSSSTCFLVDEQCCYTSRVASLLRTCFLWTCCLSLCLMSSSLPLSLTLIFAGLISLFFDDQSTFPHELISCFPCSTLAITITLRLISVSCPFSGISIAILLSNSITLRVLFYFFL